MRQSAAALFVTQYTRGWERDGPHRVNHSYTASCYCYYVPKLGFLHLLNRRKPNTCILTCHFLPLPLSPLLNRLERLNLDARLAVLVLLALLAVLPLLCRLKKVLRDGGRVKVSDGPAVVTVKLGTASIVAVAECEASSSCRPIQRRPSPYGPTKSSCMLGSQGLCHCLAEEVSSQGSSPLSQIIASFWSVTRLACEQW